MWHTSVQPLIICIEFIEIISDRRQTDDRESLYQQKCALNHSILTLCPPTYVTNHTNTHNQTLVLLHAEICMDDPAEHLRPKSCWVILIQAIYMGESIQSLN